MRIALFEPEIAGNVGAVLRLGACMGAAVDLIEGLSLRLPLDHDLLPEDRWLVDGLARVF